MTPNVIALETRERRTISLLTQFRKEDILSRGGISMETSRGLIQERRERGIALILVIQLGLAIFLLLNTWLLSIKGRTHLFNQRRERIQAYYTAEAGLARAIWNLKQNPTWRTQNSSQNLSRTKEDTLLIKDLFSQGREKCRISVVDRGRGAEITAIAISGGTTRTLKALMVVLEDLQGKKTYHFVYYKPMAEEKEE